MTSRKFPKGQSIDAGGSARKGQVRELEEPKDSEWMWGSTDRFLQKLPTSLSNATSTSQSLESSYHSVGSRCSIQLCDHGRHLYAVNKHQHAQLEECTMRAINAEIAENALEKENTVLTARVSEVTTRYCTLGVDYAAARTLIKKQRFEIALTRVVAGISIGITIVCLIALLKM